MSMITITNKAAVEIVNQAQAKGRHPGLRIAVRGGGCSGFSYAFEWGTRADTDNVFVNGDAELYIDPKSFVYLDGSIIDFETSIMQRGFKITNPAEKDRCGCGESIQF